MMTLAIVGNLILAYLVVILLYNIVTAAAGLLIGAQIKEFGVFVGPSLFRFKIGETIFRFNLLPLGGFVKFGEDYEQLHWSQRLFIIVAGLTSYFIAIFFAFGLIDGWQKFVSGFGQVFWGALSPTSEGLRLVRLLFEFVQNNSFLALIGLVSAKTAAFNVYPIGATNGGYVMLMLLKGLGLQSEKFIEKYLLVGFFLILLFMIAWAIAFVTALNS